MKNIVIQEMTNKLYIDSVDSTKRLISAAFSFSESKNPKQSAPVGLLFYIYFFKKIIQERTKVMFKNKFKKLTGFFLALVMTLVALPVQTFASDWGVGDNVYAAMLGNYIGSDGKTYADKYNYDYIYYKSDGSVGVATRYASIHAKLGVSKNGVTQQAICIEAGVSYSTGSSYVGKASSDD